MSNVGLSIWSRQVALHGFSEQELAEVRENFAGSLSDLPSSMDAELVIERQLAAPLTTDGVTRPRHRGGSSAQKYFLDGSRYDGKEQYRDIQVVSEGPRLDIYACDDTLVVVDENRATIAGPGTTPPMLLCDLIEDWLLCMSRRNEAVQIHCAAWLDRGEASLMVGSSGKGKTSELFRQLNIGSTFLSNDRAFLRFCEGILEVRSFPLPVNVGCGTIRSLGLDLPHRGLGDHDKIRLRAPEVACLFGGDYERWFPVAEIVCTSLDDLYSNIYWDEDACHPFWVRSWRPDQLPDAVTKNIVRAVGALAVERDGLEY